jgi:hypothetical protein
VLGATACAVVPLLVMLAWPYVRTSPLVGGDGDRVGEMMMRQAAGFFANHPLGDPSDLLRRLGRVTGFRRDPRFSVDAGRLALILSVAGGLISARSRDRLLRTRTTVLAGLILSGLLLALGPGFLPTPLGTLPLPLVLVDELPIIGGLRVPERFNILAVLGSPPASVFSSHTSRTSSRGGSGFLAQWRCLRSSPRTLRHCASARSLP